MDDSIVDRFADEIEVMRIRLLAAYTDLKMCCGMLEEACSPYVPSTGRDSEWLSRRDRIVTNAITTIQRIESEVYD